MPQERRILPCKLAINSATGFWADLEGDRAAGRGHQETARFPHEPSSDRADPPRRPSHVAGDGGTDGAW